MKTLTAAVLALVAGSALAQTQLVSLRWGEDGIYETATGCWFDAATGLAWLAGSKDDGGVVTPAMWTVAPDGTVSEVASSLPVGEPRARFGTFSPSGEFVVLHASEADSSAGLDDCVVTRADWSSRIDFPTDAPGGFAFVIEAVGDEAQVCGMGNPFGPGAGAYFAEVLVAQLDPVMLDDIAGGWFAPGVFSMSRHGETLAGYTFDDLAYLAPLMWHDSGAGHNLSVLDHPDWTDAIAGRVSPDARFIAGSITTYDPQLCVWDQGVPHLFEHAGGGSYYAHPRWVLDDGTIFGWTWTTPQRAFIANAELMPNPQLLEDYYMFFAGEGFAEPGESWVSQAFLGGNSYHVVFNADSGRSYYLRVPALAAPCAPDLNGDGALDFFDVQLFLQLFAAHDPRADMTGDGVYDFFDVQEYLAAFSAGCL